MIGALAVAPAAWAQATWTGGGGANQNINYGPNWQSGSPPPNNGTQTVTLTQASGANINVNANENVLGIVFTGSPGANSQYGFNDSGGTLTIGSGGLSYTSIYNANLYFNASVVLSTSETWSLGFINQSGGTISGTGTLTTTGADYIFGNNTFSGGLYVDGSFYVGSGASVGTGTVTVSDGATLGTFFSPATITNPVVLGNNANLSSGASTPLTLTGPVSFTSGTTTLNLPQYTQLYLTGTVGGSPTSLTISGGGGSPTLPIDGGAQVVFEGALNQVNGLTVSAAQVIFAPTGGAAASIASVAPSALNVGVEDGNYGYLGLDGTFATTVGAVAGFFSTYGPTLGYSINGTLGFDTTANPSSPQTFSDPIDLSQFSSPNFLGLGSATSAILSGAITPAPMGEGGAYIFGGGGGTLTLTHDLADFGFTQLVMTEAPEPVTVIIQGANNYMGPVTSYGGVLIFDSTVLPSNLITLSGGYVGYTGTPGIMPSQFIAMFNNYGSGVVGFDQSTISAPIDMSGFNSDSSVFIGTSTNATLSGTITPANEQYLFAGVKGGSLTINSQLVDDGVIPRSVTIGLLYPIESNGSTSVVNLTGDNSYSGGTTLNSDTLFINSNTALGTGTLTISDTGGTNAPYFASYGGSAVTITNPIVVGNTGDGSVQGVTLGNVYPSGNDMLVLNGVISDWGDGEGIIAIGGPVTLGAANTYTGGTIFTGIGNAEALLTNSSSLGGGPITVQDGATIAALADVTLTNTIALVGNSPLTLGQVGSDFMLTLNGAITGNGSVTINSAVTLDGMNTYDNGTIINGAEVVVGPDTTSPFGTGAVTLENGAVLGYANSPTILDLNGDGSTSLYLGSGQTLTLDADSAGGIFSGTIMGDGTNQVVKIDTGMQQLYGSSTYGGGTSVNGGTLIAGANGALGTGPVTVASGAQLGVANGVTLANTVTLSGGSILSGNGTFSAASPFTFSGGTTVMPGNPISGQFVSTLTLSNDVTFGTGGVYVLDVANAGGSAGVDYSTLSIEGTLTVTAAANSFTIDLTSISPGSGPGLATFNAALPYTWTIVSAGSISMFNAGDFTFDTGAFQNSLAGGGFTIAQSGNTLTLDFTPVPEPSTWALMAAGLAAVAACALRRRRQGV